MAEVASTPVTASTVMLRVTVRAPDLDTFVQRYCRHLNGDRIFIFTDSPRTTMTRIRFSLQLSDGQPLINGQGVVVRTQLDTGDRRRPPGMELQFKALDEPSQLTVDLMAAANAATQKPPTPLVRAVIAAPPPPPVRPPMKPLGPRLATAPALPMVTPPAPTPIAPVDIAPVPPALASVPRIPPRVVTPATAAQTMPAWPPTPSSSTSKTELGATMPLQAMDAASSSLSSPLALTADGNLPANPFMGVSDGALEYFVEWSFEQSVGPHQDRAATFSDVSMNLAAKTGSQTAISDAATPIPAQLPAPNTAMLVATRPQRRRVSGVLLASFGVLIGIGVGGAGVYVIISRRAPAVVAPTPVAVVAPAPVAAAPVAPEPEPERPVPPPRVAAPPAAVLETVRIDSRPPGANLTVDGSPAGRTPQILHLSAGTHQIELTRERYEPVKRTVEAPGNLTLNLRRPASRLHISSTPPAAQVIIGGVARGRTPVDVKLPGFESYKVELALNGQKPWQRSIYLRTQDSDLTASLSPIARPAPKRH